MRCGRRLGLAIPAILWQGRYGTKKRLSHYSRNQRSRRGLYDWLSFREGFLIFPLSISNT